MSGRQENLNFLTFLNVFWEEKTKTSTPNLMSQAKEFSGRFIAHLRESPRDSARARFR